MTEFRWASWKVPEGMSWFEARSRMSFPHTGSRHTCPSREPLHSPHTNLIESWADYLVMRVNRKADPEYHVWCNICGKTTGPLIHAWLRREGIDLTAVPLVSNNLASLDDGRRDPDLTYEETPYGIRLGINIKCEHTDCYHVAEEWHHWAPKEVFGVQEADNWPLSALCGTHHRAWHSAMRAARFAAGTGIAS